MKSFEYADEEIGSSEISLLLPSVVIGAGVLSLPRELANNTRFADGWISILIGGGMALVFTWLVTKLASQFPNKSFFEYSSSLVSKPVAWVLTVLAALYFMCFSAYEIRAVATLSKQYLFDTTPIEILAFVFLLVVTYAVSGSRVALFRLNQLFLPIIIIALIMIILVSLPLVRAQHLFPLFQTNWTGYLKGVQSTFLSFTGWGVLLFYTGLVNQPKKAPKAAVTGMMIPIAVYLFIYITAIGVFSNIVTANLIYPTNELAKVTEVPGGFLERLEIVFFTIWVMALFTTSMVFFDITIMALQSIFKKTKKKTFILILAPIIYLIGMLPQDEWELSQFSDILGYVSIVISTFIPAILLGITKWRGTKRNG